MIYVSLSVCLEVVHGQVCQNQLRGPIKLKALICSYQQIARFLYANHGCFKNVTMVLLSMDSMQINRFVDRNDISCFDNTVYKIGDRKGNLDISLKPGKILRSSEDRVLNFTESYLIERNCNLNINH